MKLVKKIFGFYINSSIHVALAVCALTRISEFYFGIPNNVFLDCFIFFGTITGYNFVKYAGIAKWQHKRLTGSLKIIQLFSLMSFCGMVYFGSQVEFKTLLWVIPFALLTLFYAVPTVKGFAKNLRNIPSVKIIIIALVWAGITVLLPAFDERTYNLGTNNNVFVALVFIQRLLFVIVLTLPFDIRDLRLDNKNLQTIPQVIGVEKTKKLGFILLLITLVIEFFISPNSNFKAVFLIVFTTLLILLQRASTNQKKYYASFWIEAIPIFWIVLLLIFNKFVI